MSYSRWSNSFWYTYHDIESGKTLETQIFTIAPLDGEFHKFSYSDLKRNRNECIKKMGVKAKLQDWTELQDLIDLFIENMEQEYKEEPQTKAEEL